MFSLTLVLLCSSSLAIAYKEISESQCHLSEGILQCATNLNEEVECPPGLFQNGSKCVCGRYPDNIILCNGIDSSVQSCNCMTFDESRNVTLVGGCMYYNCGSHVTRSGMELFYHSVPTSTNQLTSEVCKPLNRTGALCGRCLPDHYPLAYSFNMACIPCPHTRWNWVRYLMAAYIPLTLFYLIILFFKVNITLSSLLGIITQFQTMSLPVLLRVVLADVQINASNSFLQASNTFMSFYGIWNLDFFRPFYSDLCLGMGVLPTLALDYAIAVYPLFLMIITYLLILLYDKNYRIITTIWAPLRFLLSLFKKNWNIKTSVIDAFATFFLLSNVKFLSVSFDLLAPTRVYQLYPEHYNYTLGLYYAGDVEYFSKDHLPYAILAIVLLCVFVILPTTLLALYPFSFFQKFLNCFPFRWYVLHTFMDAFQGCYKNGTEPGTRDCRWFASVYFLVRLGLFVAFALIPNIVFFTVGAAVLMLLVTLIMAVQPYKDSLSRHNLTNAVFIQLLALCFISISAITLSAFYIIQCVFLFYALCFAVGCSSLIYAVALVMYQIFKSRKFCLRLLQGRRNGYIELPESVIDDIIVGDRM